MIKTECEIIAIIDAVDELSSHNFQVCYKKNQNLLLVSIF